MVSYGVALVGLVVSATIYLHVSIYLATEVPSTDFFYLGRRQIRLCADSG
jgi:hypothetical protein